LAAVCSSIMPFSIAMDSATAAVWPGELRDGRPGRTIRRTGLERVIRTVNSVAALARLHRLRVLPPRGRETGTRSARVMSVVARIETRSLGRRLSLPPEALRLIGVHRVSSEPERPGKATGLRPQRSATRPRRSGVSSRRPGCRRQATVEALAVSAAAGEVPAASAVAAEEARTLPVATAAGEDSAITRGIHR